MEIKGSVQMEIRPLHCPLQNSTCVNCKYHIDTYIDKENSRLTAIITCNFDKKIGE